MAAKVIDTSALAAVVFAEPEGQRIAARMENHDLLAPFLLPFELANVCLMKIRRHPAQKTLLLAGYEMVSRLPLMFMAVNMTEVLGLAQDKALTAYDASFLWLAKTLDVELMTLDKTLAKAFAPRKGQ